MGRDIPMGLIGLFILITALFIFLFFNFGVVNNTVHAVVGLLIVLIIAFLFTTVAARAIAIVGTNPVSGMTLMTHTSWRTSTTPIFCSSSSRRCGGCMRFEVPSGYADGTHRGASGWMTILADMTGVSAHRRGRSTRPSLT